MSGRIIIGCLAMFLCPVTCLGLTVVRDGQSATVIRVAPGEDKTIQQGATELAEILGRISGATIEVQTKASQGDAEPSGAILIGKAASDLGLTMEQTSAAGDGFRYAVRDGRLLIVGESAWGVYHGIFDFLESLGCGWYTPGKVGEVIPSRSTITIPDDLDHTEVSDSVSGMFWYGGGGNKAMGDWRTLRDWNAKNKEHHVVASWNHAWRKLVPVELFEEHPEYFALVNGKRSSRQICTTHPDVIRISADYLLKQMKERPEQIVFAAGPNDGGNLCECDRCAKLHTEGYIEFSNGKPVYTDVVYTFANELAAITSQTYPDKQLGLFVYGDYTMAPSTKISEIHPNVFPMTAPIRRCRRHGPGNPICHWNVVLNDEIHAWSKATHGKLGMYFYNYNLADNLVPFTKFDFYKRSMAAANSANITTRAWTAETMDSWAIHAPHLYLSKRLMWDSQIDIDAELDRFFNGFYGSAAKPMKQYWLRIDDAYTNTDTHTGSQYAIHHVWTPSLLEQCRRDLAEAKRLVANEREQEAVTMAEVGFQCAELFMQIWHHIEALDFLAAEKVQNELHAHLIKHSGPAEPPSLIYLRYARDYYNTFIGRTVNGGADVLRNGGKVQVKIPNLWRFQKDENGVGAEQGWWKPETDDHDWATIQTFNRSWDDEGLGWYHGDAWYRTRFTLPETADNADLRLWFGGFDFNVDVYLNGVHLGERRGFAKPGEYSDIRQHLHTDKENVLAVRIFTGDLAEIGTGGIMMPVMIYEPGEITTPTKREEGVNALYDM